MKTTLLGLLLCVAPLALANITVGSASPAVRYMYGTTPPGQVANGNLALLVVDVNGDGFVDQAGGMTSGSQFETNLEGLNRGMAGLQEGSSFGGDIVIKRLSTSSTGITVPTSSLDISNYLGKPFAIIWFENVPSTTTGTLPVGTTGTNPLVPSLGVTYYGLVRGSDWVFPSTNSGSFTFGTVSGASTFTSIIYPNSYTASPSAGASDATVALYTNGTDQIVWESTPQVITFPALTTKRVGDAPFVPPVTVTSNVNLYLYLTSSNPAVATVSGSRTVTIVGAGTTTLTAYDWGAWPDWDAAPPVAQTLTVNSATAGYDSWAATGGLDASHNGPLLNPAGDGIPNLLKYVLNGNPLASCPGILPTRSRDASGNLLITFYRRADSAVETVQTVESSADLAHWTGISVPASSAGGVTITPDTPSQGVQKVDVIIPGPSSGSLFARLRVNR